MLINVQKISMLPGHIKTAYKIDKHSLLRQRQLLKLTDRHILPHLIPKMKVKYAVEALSHNVANFMDIIITFNKGNINI